MKLRNGMMAMVLTALVAGAAGAESGKPRLSASSTQSHGHFASEQRKAITAAPDLVIQPRMKMSDIIGAPNTGFCGILGGHVIVTFYVRNRGKGASLPTTAKLSFSNAYNFSPNFYSTTVNVKGLKPGERDLLAYPIPNEAWQAHSNGNGHSAAFRIIVKGPEGEQVITNNWVKYHCIGGPA